VGATADRIDTERASFDTPFEWASDNEETGKRSETANFSKGPRGG